MAKKKSNYKLSYLDKIYYSENLLLAVEKEKKFFINKDVKINLRKAIVFEDNDIIILNKPYGMPVQGDLKLISVLMMPYLFFVMKRKR